MKTIISILKFITLIIALFFITNYFLINWHRWELLNIVFNVRYVGISLIVLLFAWIVNVLILRQQFKVLSKRISFLELFAVYFLSMIGRYLPGKFWQIAGSIYLAKKKGVPEGIAITAFILAQIYFILGGIAIFCVSLLRGEFSGLKLITSLTKYSSGLALAIMLFLTLKPKLIEYPVNLILKIFKREIIAVRINIINSISILLFYVILWFIFGLAFWLFVNGLTPVPFRLYLSLTGVFAAAVSIGFLAVFAPGGLGVREGIMVLLLTSFGTFETPLPVAIAVGFRIVMTISELIMFGSTWVIEWISKRR